MKRCLVLGANGHIGTALVAHLKREGAYVRTVGRSIPLYKERGAWFLRQVAAEYNVADLRFSVPLRHFEQMDEVYQLAAEVGGLGYIQDPGHDANIMVSNTRMNLNVLEMCTRARVGRVLFTSSACVYPVDSDVGSWVEDWAYPAQPQNAFGWEKLYAERLYQAHARTHLLNVRIARLDNTYGPGCEWREPRAKVVAALCRKVADLPPEGGALEVWGDGTQVRSFLHVSDAVEGLVALMRSDFHGPVNLGSGEGVTVARLANLIASAAGKPVRLAPSPGPVGSRSRVLDVTLAREKLGWAPRTALADGLAETYRWVERQVFAECK